MPKFYIVNDEWEVTSTDSLACATAAAEDESTIAVIDVEANKDLCAPVQEIKPDTVYNV